MKRMLLSSLTLALCVIAAAQSAKPTIVVAPFAPPRECQGSEIRAVGDHVADMITNALVKSGYSLIERMNLGHLDDETYNSLIRSGQDRLSNEARADYMIVGSVTANVKVTDLIVVKETRLSVNIQARVVAVGTHRIVGTIEASGTEKSQSISIIPIQSGAPDFEKALNKAAADLVKKMPSLPEVIQKGSTPEPTTTTVTTHQFSDVIKAYRYLILLPESHIRLVIPDPAAETELKKALLAVGLSVYDGPRLAELRREDWVREAFRGTLTSMQLQEIKNRLGVDVLITGEAFSERAELNTVPGIVACRARVEIKALILETGQLIMADSATSSGRDAGEMMASKAALRNAGCAAAPLLLQKLSLWKTDSSVSGPNAVTIDLQIGGWKKISETDTFLRLLCNLDGVQSAKRKDFRGSILFAEITLTKKALESFPGLLEVAPSLKRFNIGVETSSDSKVQGNIGK